VTFMGSWPTYKTEWTCSGFNGGARASCRCLTTMYYSGHYQGVMPPVDRLSAGCEMMGYDMYCPSTSCGVYQHDSCQIAGGCGN
jgi:hypothetical protein